MGYCFRMYPNNSFQVNSKLLCARQGRPNELIQEGSVAQNSSEENT